jgi:RNA-directed DNA polymerase
MDNLFQLYNQLGVNKNFLHFLISNLDEHYYQKIKPKMKFGKPQEEKNNSIKLRHLIPPVQSLKLIQSRICNHLQKVYLPDCMYGAVDESNNVLNALQHIESKYFFTIDLKDFFSKISHKQVHQMFI